MAERGSPCGEEVPIAAIQSRLSGDHPDVKRGPDLPGWRFVGNLQCGRATVRHAADYSWS